MSLYNNMDSDRNKRNGSSSRRNRYLQNICNEYSRQKSRKENIDVLKIRKLNKSNNLQKYI